MGMSNLLEVYTDGATLYTTSSKSPGTGAWAFVIPAQGNNVIKEYKVSGKLHNTTSNYSELYAGIQAIKFVIDKNLLEGFDGIEIISDSMYHVKNANDRLEDWVLRGWISATGALIVNVELWQEVLKLKRQVPIKWTWVKAHTGNFYNEMADGLVRKTLHGEKVVDTV